MDERDINNINSWLKYAKQSILKANEWIQFAQDRISLIADEQTYGIKTYGRGLRDEEIGAEHVTNPFD